MATIYLSQTARDQLDQTQKVIDKHTQTKSKGRCVECQERLPFAALGRS